MGQPAARDPHPAAFSGQVSADGPARVVSGLTAKYPHPVLPLLLFGCATEPAHGDCADDCRRYTVSLTVVTEDWTGDAQETAAVLDELVNNLNLAFRTRDGAQIFAWEAGSAHPRRTLDDAIAADQPCASLARLGDADHMLSNDEISDAIAPCAASNGALFDPHAFNVYLYDAADEQGDPDDTTSRGGRTNDLDPSDAEARYPRVLIDYARLGRGDNVEAHEFGHAFTLGHLCLPPSTADTETPAMATPRDWDLCETDADGACIRSCADLGGSTGTRALGFSAHPQSYDEARGRLVDLPSELAILSEVADEHDVLLGAARTGEAEPRW